jgi:hypothetical protein
MTDGLVVGDGGASDGHLSGSGLDRTGPLTSGTGPLGPELERLLVQGLLDGPLDQRPSGIDGDLFEGVEVEIEAWPVVPERPAGDDFSPPLGQGANLVLIRRRGSLERHGEFSLRLGETEKMGNSY